MLRKTTWQSSLAARAYKLKKIVKVNKTDKINKVHNETSCQVYIDFYQLIDKINNN